MRGIIDFHPPPLSFPLGGGECEGVVRDRWSQPELPIIQKTYDLILWYVPWLNKFPRDQKFILGDRIQNTLYTILEGSNVRFGATA